MTTVPHHIAVTPDGNRRWAKERGLTTAEGHNAGAASFVRFTELCARHGVGYLTMHAFSTDNWKREPEEVEHMLDLLGQTVVDQLPQLDALDVRLRWAGRRDRVSSRVRHQLEVVEDRTQGHGGMTLTYCLDYGGRDAVADALAAAVAEVPDPAAPLSATALFDRVEPAGLPDVDLYLRTSGEMRLSNNVLWHLAYAELFFENTYWPDFGPDEFEKLMHDYARRTRRFGGH